MHPQHLILALTTIITVAIGLIGEPHNSRAQPTAIPTPQATATIPPTREAKLYYEGSAPQPVLRVGGTILSVDLAAHPIDNWPAVGIIHYPIPGRDPRRAFVAAFDQQRGTWNDSWQIDYHTSLGSDPFASLQLAISGDDTITALYGPDDAPWQPGQTPPANAWSIWARTSHNLGQHWSAPQRIASGCWSVLSSAATPGGWVVGLLACGREHETWQPTLVVRQPNGHWRPEYTLPTSDMLLLQGSVALSGDGDQARAVLALYSMAQPTQLTLATIQLSSGTTTFSTHPLGSLASSSHMHRNFRALSYIRLPTQQPAISISWIAQDEHAGAVYALTSLDGGHSWGDVEQIASAPNTIIDAALSYDPVPDTLIAMWPCCGDTTFQSLPASHYSAWSTPGSGRWSTAEPLVSSARIVGHSDTGHGLNARTTWLAWVEQQQTLMVRSYGLNQIGQIARP
jgi:hypothetical protein